MTETGGDTVPGNCPEKWVILLRELDEKLQLGLLTRLQRALSYHIESDELVVTPKDTEDLQYLSKENTVQQLRLIAEACIGVKTISIGTNPESE